MLPIFDKIHKGLIVSCQSDVGDPFDSPEYTALFAKTAVMGGARGIRARGKESIEKILTVVDVPVIGLTKSQFEDGWVRISGSFGEVEELVESRCHIIAVDGTFRKREDLSGPEFIQELKKRYDCIIMADISTYSEGIACADYGADCVSSTLSGYTPDTQFYPKDEPDYNLVAKLSREITIPIIAEGKINHPKFAKHMIEYGAWAVVVGTAITRPRVITKWFCDEIANAHFEEGMKSS
jgi:N-acylglucosamine-6-phosphate 2-epimerase